MTSCMGDLLVLAWARDKRNFVFYEAKCDSFVTGMGADEIREHAVFLHLLTSADSWLLAGFSPGFLGRKPEIYRRARGER